MSKTQDLDDAKAEIAQLRESVSGGTKRSLEIIGALLDELGINDVSGVEVPDERVAEILGGCDCNGEEGTQHLIWHLARQRDSAVKDAAEGIAAAIQARMEARMEAPFIKHGVSEYTAGVRDGLKAAAHEALTHVTRKGSADG